MGGNVQYVQYLLSQRRALYHQSPVDRLGLDAVNKLKDGDGVPEGLVLEALDGALSLAPRLQPVVGPGDDLGLHDGGPARIESGEEAEGVGSHQLPDQGQGQCLVTVQDVLAWGEGGEYESIVTSYDTAIL